MLKKTVLFITFILLPSCKQSNLVKLDSVYEQDNNIFLKVSDIECQFCANTVKDSLLKLNGVKEVSFQGNCEDGLLNLTCDNSIILTKQEVEIILKDAGFDLISFSLVSLGKSS